MSAEPLCYISQATTVKVAQTDLYLLLTTQSMLKMDPVPVVITVQMAPWPQYSAQWGRTEMSQGLLQKMTALHAKGDITVKCQVKFNPLVTLSTTASSKAICCIIFNPSP